MGSGSPGLVLLMFSSIPRWYDPNLLPTDNGEQWRVFENNVSKEVPEDQIRRRLKRWSPLLLVAEPGAGRFATPVTIPAFSEDVLQTVWRRGRSFVLLYGIGALLLSLMYLAKPSPGLGSLVFILASMMCAFLIDYKGPLGTVQGVDERARFTYWLHLSTGARVGAFASALFGSSIGVMQVALSNEIGGTDEIFHRYGFMYDAVRQGELWRALTGPLLHYSLLHYITNMVFLLVVGPLCWALLGGAVTLIVFVCGNAVGAAAQMILGGTLYDNCGGISFGCYALFGVLIGVALLRPRFLPRGLGLFAAMIAVIGIVGVELGSQVAATAGHIAGLATGCLCAPVVSIILRGRS